MQSKNIFLHPDVGEYTITKSSRASRLTLRIGRDGKPNVTMPHRMPVVLGRQFFAQNLTWVKEHAIETHLWKPGVTYSLYDDTVVSISSGSRNSKKIQTSSLDIVIVDGSKGQKYAQDTVKQFLAKDTESVVLPLLDDISQEMELFPEKVQFKATTSRWGSCSSQGVLTFSSYMAQLPKECIRYVIVHELAHLEQMNHSANFWSIVKKYEPNHKELRKQLKEYVLRPEVTKIAE